uniref:Uncharacterized protein n=1 Tax=Vitrella brassicaformis TaxID=1169539 RepID=A0A7S1KD76_9ALVE|mmetsp:Transcript_48150/g.120547  ORF Transcript_48150/g.120547 Transcript_48150/m.120547 type:complete len:146 (+) Transcript_48150:476-913(+)
MLYGREAVHPSSTARLVAMNAEPIDVEEAVELIKEGLQAVHKKARETMSKKKQQATEREKHLPWRTVGIVQEKKGPVTYKVRVCGDQKARSINVDRLKRAPPPEDEEAPPPEDEIEVTEGDLEGFFPRGRPRADSPNAESIRGHI